MLFRIAELDYKIGSAGNATETISTPQGTVIVLQVKEVKTAFASGKLFYSIADNLDEHFFSSKSMPIS